MSSDCLFCRIASKEIPSEWVAENEVGFVIRDIEPQAPHHFLVISKEHFPSLVEAGEEVLGKLLSLGKKVAQEQGLLPDGFRTVINTGEKGGQTVFHLHIHLLGGGPLTGNFA